MAIARSMSLAIALAAGAQNPTRPAGLDHAAHHPPDAAAVASAPADRMATVDAQMTRKPERHDKMVRAGTRQERQALMAEQMMLMQDGMAMMGGVGHGGMGGIGGMGLAGAASAPLDMAARQRMMEERMEMMQMMAERTNPPVARP